MNQEKRKYFEPQMKFVRFETEDIITTSVTHSDAAENPGINLPIDPFIQ